MQNLHLRYARIGAILLFVIIAALLSGCRAKTPAESREKLHDPAYLASQTRTLQPQVIAKLREIIPDATVSEAAASAPSGNIGCTVQLPPEKADQMGKVMERMIKVKQEYSRQGYIGVFELYLGERLVKRIP
ncbi:MAG TPA: hypothetical protein PLZ36_07150 [Armatimonadota bacterium]|nr:hypothetical protein [Armatimonadota bacterium]